MDYFPQTTGKSPGLLLSFPVEILHKIFNLLLTDEIYNNAYKIDEGLSLSFQVLSLSSLVRQTQNIRGACSSWAHATRSLVFRRKSTRGGLVLKLRRRLSEEDIKIFPLLRDCMVEFSTTSWLHELYSLQQDIANSTAPLKLDYICAVCWDTDRFTATGSSATSAVVYERFKHQLANPSSAEGPIVTGVKIAGCNGNRPSGWGKCSSDDTEWVAGWYWESGFRKLLIQRDTRALVL